MKKFAALIGLALLGACSSDKSSRPEIDAKTVTFNDFEAGGGWSSDPGHNNISLVTKDKAHSGQYALKVDKDHEFSLTFDMPLGQISSTKFKTLHMEAWVFMLSERSTATISMQVMSADNIKAVDSDELKFRDAVKKYNQWVHVSKDFVLHDNITAAQHLRVFMWRADASQEAYLDDIKLSIKD